MERKRIRSRQTQRPKAPHITGHELVEQPMKRLKKFEYPNLDFAWEFMPHRGIKDPKN